MKQGNGLHWYYGNGKGKTTAAMGLAFRALGHGQRVLAAQFMKTGNSGELKALKAFPGAQCLLAKPMEGFTFQMSQQQLAQAAREQQKLIKQIAEALPEQKPRLILLDEMGSALQTGLIDEAEALSLAESCLDWGETIITGGQPTPVWLEKTDYVSEICKRKHPYDAGVQARQGVEW